MDDSLEKLKQTWQTLGTEDPLWAISSLPGKRGGKWDVGEFLAVGESDVEQFHELLRRTVGAPERFERVLDFGCGVGRLTCAWARRADSVIGVDISKPMVERGNALLQAFPNVRLQVNEADDLACFEPSSFDLVFSHACLQHMPWKLAAGYIREFGRVCSPGGWVMFTVPFRPVSATWHYWIRRRLVDALPFGLGGAYRRWRHGSAAVFDMYYTPPERVAEAVAAGGLQLLRREPDRSGGDGFFYIGRKT
jgi:SAM-dependent methyltransferase